MCDYWIEHGIVKPQQVVVCAACVVGDVILCGARHWDKVMRTQAKALGIKYVADKQGFIDQFGDFLTREEAMNIAIAAGQKVDIKEGCGGDKMNLYSEGLY